MSIERDDGELIAAARQEAQRMIGAVAAAGGDAVVTMTVAQFRTLARLIGGLADAASRDDAFDAPIDGIRFWVPLPYLAAERARLAAAQPGPHHSDRFAF